MYLRGIRLIARIGSGLFLPVLFFLALSSCTEDQPGILELENTPLKFEDTPFVPENAQETTTSALLRRNSQVLLLIFGIKAVGLSNNG